MSARCVSAGVRRWEGEETHAALPTGVTPVRLPDPALQLCAVLGRRGTLGWFGGEVASVIGPRSCRHVRYGDQASLS